MNTISIYILQLIMLILLHTFSLQKIKTPAASKNISLCAIKSREHNHDFWIVYGGCNSKKLAFF